MVITNAAIYRVAGAKTEPKGIWPKRDHTYDEIRKEAIVHRRLKLSEGGAEFEEEPVESEEDQSAVKTGDGITVYRENQYRNSSEARFAAFLEEAHLEKDTNWFYQTVTYDLEDVEGHQDYAPAFYIKSFYNGHAIVCEVTKEYPTTVFTQ